MSLDTNLNRIVQKTQYDGTGYTNENSLYNAMLTRPDKLNPVVTHLMGKESDKFPLTFLTEGQAGGIHEVNDVQYTWPVIGKLRKADEVDSTPYTGTDTPGLNFQPFTVIMKTAWIKGQHLVVSPNGVWARVMSKGVPVGGGKTKYQFQLIEPNAAAYCPLSELAPGTKWSMTGGAPVSESFSVGNASNVITPGEMKNQISILRKSYRLGGNISNKMVEFQFNVGTKTQTNLWMDWERYLHTMDWKQVIEEHIWESKYNRLPDGSIALKDQESGLPIPIGAGVIDQIPNSDTYGVLTARKLKNTVRDVMYGATDTGAMTVVLYTGTGGADEFDSAMKEDLKSSGWQVITGNTFITGTGRNLTLGGFFTAYEHVDGHKIVLKKLPILDHGGRAESAPLHPITGLPMTSYEMYFVDQSDYDGQRNVQMVVQRGRNQLTGILKGMAKTPYDVKGDGEIMVATEQDASSVHFLATRGVVIRRNTHCFKLTCNLS